MIEDLPITDKLYFISVFVMQLPQLYSSITNKTNTLNIYSVVISICVWITFSIKAWRRTKLGWLYMLIGLTNLLISIILTYNIYTSNRLSNQYSINTQYTYDMPVQMHQDPSMQQIYTNQYNKHPQNQYQNSLFDNRSSHNKRFNHILKKNIGTASYERNNSYPFIDHHSLQDNSLKRYPIRI